MQLSNVKYHAVQSNSVWFSKVCNVVQLLHCGPLWPSQWPPPMTFSPPQSQHWTSAPQQRSANVVHIHIMIFFWNILCIKHDSVHIMNNMRNILCIKHGAWHITHGTIPKKPERSCTYHPLDITPLTPHSIHHTSDLIHQLHKHHIMMRHDAYLEPPDDEGERFGSVGCHYLAALHGEAVVPLFLTCQVWGRLGKRCLVFAKLYFGYKIWTPLPSPPKKQEPRGSSHGQEENFILFGVNLIY